jgi:hypothetical protein
MGADSYSTATDGHLRATGYGATPCRSALSQFLSHSLPSGTVHQRSPGSPSRRPRTVVNPGGRRPNIVGKRVTAATPSAEDHRPLTRRCPAASRPVPNKCPERYTASTFRLAAGRQCNAFAVSAVSGPTRNTREAGQASGATRRRIAGEARERRNAVTGGGIYRSGLGDRRQCGRRRILRPLSGSGPLADGDCRDASVRDTALADMMPTPTGQ